jgi:chaperonin GroES
MNLRTVYDGIVMMRISRGQTTPSASVISDFPQPAEVMVVATGERLDDHAVELHVSVGDRILFGKFAYGKDKQDGAEFMLVREDDVLGVLSVSAHAAKKAE